MINSPVAYSAEQMSMVMASMSIELQHAHLKEKSMAGEGDWIDAVRLYGGFDIARDSGYQDGKIVEIHALLEGAIGFIKNFNYRWVDKDPVFGTIEETEHAEYNGPTGLRNAFVRLVDHFITAEALREKIPAPHGQSAISPSSIAMIHSKLMGGAIVMNLPDAVEKLTKSCPEAVSHVFPKDLLGENSKSNKEHCHTINPTPYGLALMFSRTECLEAMANWSNNQTLPIALEFLGGQKDLDYYNLVRAFYLPDRHFLPGAFAAALTHAFDRPMEPRIRDIHLMTALKCLEHKGNTGERNHLVPAYLAAGVYNINPAESIAVAIEHGHPEVVLHFKNRIPWAELPFDDEKQSPVLKCLIEAQANNRSELHQDALVALIDAAIADGQYDRVMQTFAKPLYTNGDTEEKRDELGNVINLVDPGDDNNLWGPVEIEPLTRIVNMGFDRVLLKALDQGLDPNAPASDLPGSWTPLQIAEAIPSSALAVMKSHQARAKSFALLAEMAVEELRP